MIDWSRSIPVRRVKPLLLATTGSVPVSWRDRIAASRGLLYDDGNGPYLIDEESLPPIRRLS